MVVNNGLSIMLQTFVLPLKDANRITSIEFGLDTSGEIVDNDTPDGEFVMVLRHPIATTNMTITEYHTLGVRLTLDGSTVLPTRSVLKFSSMRLIFENGTVYAWRRFPPRVLGHEYRAVIEWDILLDDLCWNAPSNIEWNNIIGRPNASPDGIDRMVDSSHTHDNSDILGRMGESGDIPNIDGDDIVRIFWNGDET